MSTTPTPPVVDIGEPASNTSTTRPGRVDQQPRPHHLPATGVHTGYVSGGGFLLAAGIGAVLLARRPRGAR